MIAASVIAGDPLDGRGQVAIAVGDEVGELVDLCGRFGRRFDLDPAADAVEDRLESKGLVVACHWLLIRMRIASIV